MNVQSAKVFSGLIFSGLLFFGCGGSDSSSSSSSSSPASGTYNVSVIDDKIIGATLSAPECSSFTSNGGGSYTLTGCVSTPSVIEAVGGFVDIDGDGNQSDTEVTQAAPLKLRVSQSGLSNGFMVTPLSTLASQEDENLSALATSLGVSTADLFKDNSANRGLQRAINAILISAREAGINKYDNFIRDFKDRVKASGSKGIGALSLARSYMEQNADNYKETYGVVLAGFISDANSLDLSSNPLAQVKSKNTIELGKIRLSGIIFDGIINGAAISIYQNGTLITSSTSDSAGRYVFDIDETYLNSAKVFKFEAIKGNIKLVSYLTTDEIKAGLIGKKLSSAVVEDLVISNVTTAKAVLVEKTAGVDALRDPAKLVGAKALVESLYQDELVTVSAAIKDVVDNSKTISQSDTLALAQSIVSVDATTKAVTTTVPSGITTNAFSVTSDPLLAPQLKSTDAVDTTSFKALRVNKTWYAYDGDESNGSEIYAYYYRDSTVNTDNSFIGKSYLIQNGSESLFKIETFPAGSGGWSSDGKTMIAQGSSQSQAFREEIVATETLTLNGKTVHAYHTKQIATAEPSDSFYSSMSVYAYNQGTLGFHSMSDSGPKRITINYNNGSDTFYLNEATKKIQYSQGTDSPYSYRTVIRNGKTFIIVDVSHDGDGKIYYLDFTNQIAHENDYNPVGFVEYSISYDSNEIGNILKNLTPSQKTALNTYLSNARTNISPSNTWYSAGEKGFHLFLKSL